MVNMIETIKVVIVCLQLNPLISPSNFLSTVCSSANIEFNVHEIVNNSFIT